MSWVLPLLLIPLEAHPLSLTFSHSLSDSKLTLDSFSWTVFDAEEPDEGITKQFLELAQKQLEDKSSSATVTSEPSLQSSMSSASRAKRIRSLNPSRIHSQST